MTSPITTHVLDTAHGVPAEGVRVALEQESEGRFHTVGEGTTDADGRLRTLLPGGPLPGGAYRITFDVGSYFAARGVDSFWRHVAIEFFVKDPDGHYHVPLLVSPYGYSTYRGS